ncbi:MAG: IscA/HesB family protein [Desulfovibrionaceae bacterium]
MITMTDAVCTELEGYFADKEKENIRIYLAHGGCGGPKLALALDAATDEDESFSLSGFSFCMEKNLVSTLGDIHIDLTPMGFSLEAANPLPTSEGCCGSCSCGGSCAH